MRLEHLGLGNGFQTQVMTFSLEHLLAMVKHGDLELCPYYKYSKSWSKSDRVQFIEAILLGVPINNLWFEQDAYGGFSMIDGTQCVKTVVDFVNDKFPLLGLNLLDSVRECHFSDLPYAEQIKILRSEVIVRVMNYDVAPLLKCELFKRITSGSMRGHNQLARNYAFRDAYEAIQELQSTLSNVFEFNIGRVKYGEEQAQWQIRQQEFVLGLLLVQVLVTDPEQLRHQWSVVFALDYIAMLLNQGELSFDFELFQIHHQRVVESLFLEGFHFGHKTVISFSHLRQPLQKAISASDYLCSLLNNGHYNARLRLKNSERDLLHSSVSIFQLRRYMDVHHV